MPAFEWDGSEEKAREQRIAERRERVQERIRQAQRQRDKAIGVQRASLLNEQALPSTRAIQQVGSSRGAVSRVLDECTAAVLQVTHAADQRLERYRSACDAEEAALREQVAKEAEHSRGENRAIELEWEELQKVKQPQALHAAMEAVNSHCQRVLATKDAVLGRIRALLQARDEQYIKLLQAQGEETDILVAAMHEQHARLKGAQEAELEAVEAAYMQERSELLGVQKNELEGLLVRRSSVEQEFMEQYLAACEQYQQELEAMRAGGVTEHAALRRRLEAEVAGLQLHLDGLKATHALNADKLSYNYRVLVERERESKDALLHQKRRITREWAALNRLRKRYAAADAQHAADNTRLSDEYQHVARAFNHLQHQSRRCKAANRARFEQVRGMKEEKLSELLEELLEADQIIGSYVVGLPLSAGNDKATVQPQGSSAAESAPSLTLVGTALATSATAVVGSNQLMSVWQAEEMSPGSGRAALQRNQTPSPADDAQAADQEKECGLHLDAGAIAELLASIDNGALSLLMTDGTQRLSMQKLRALLSQVPSADGQLTAVAVARCLGLQLESTIEALDLVFRGPAAEADDAHGPTNDSPLAVPVRPQEAAGNADAPAEDPVHTFGKECVELGLQELVQHLVANPSAGGSHPASCPQNAPQAAAWPAAQQPAITQASPTSKQYWQARADALLPHAVLKTWKLLQQQATSQFATLQSRTSTADMVLALQDENYDLKAQLSELLSSPVHAQLQLPPTLLLR